jgi:glucose 1-dehydrogenase
VILEVTVYPLREGEFLLKAMAVVPGKPNSIDLADLPEPSVDDISNERGALVEVLCVGVDGTGKEINDAEYGVAIGDGLPAG